MFGRVSVIPRLTLGSGRPGVLYLCLASFFLNVVLFAFLFRPQHRAVLTTDPPSKSIEFSQKLPAKPESASAQDSPTAAVSPSFNWAQVEAADYRQYVANLRAVGCPEETLRDIVCADLLDHYSSRAAAIWKRHSRAYWQKPVTDQPGLAEREKLFALSKDQEAVVRDILGAPWRNQEFIDVLYLQLHGTERELLFLPSDKQSAALRALAESGYDAREAKTDLDDTRWQRRGELFKDKLQVLAEVLSPSELEEFRLRNSPSGDTLRTELQFFNCTPEEFKSLLDAREKPGQEKISWDDLLDRSAATEQVRRLFGDERAVEFERVTDPVYINARRAAEENSLPIDLADRVWELWRDAREQSQQITSARDLTPEEQRNQLSVLTGKVETRISDLIGSDASQGVRRDVRTILRGYGARIGK